MIYMGIDAGAKGGISYIHENGVDVTSIPFSESGLIDICQEMRGKECICYLEQVHAMPNQGVTSMFHFGENFGYIRGVLEDNRINYVLVSPQKWKKYFGLNKDKQLSIDICKDIFPNVNLFRTPRCKKESDGMAESLLLAEYGRVKNG